MHQFGVSKKDHFEELIMNYRIFSQCSRDEAERYILKLYQNAYFNTTNRNRDNRVLLVFALPETQISEAIMRTGANSTNSRVWNVPSDGLQNISGQALSIPGFLPYIMIDDLSDELRLLLMLDGVELDNIEQGDY